LKILKKKID
jgi:hypothetical protein